MNRRYFLTLCIFFALLALGIILAVCAAAELPENNRGPSSRGPSSAGSSDSASSFSAPAPGPYLIIAVLNAEDFHTENQVGLGIHTAGTYAAVADLIEANAIDIIVFNECSPWDARQLSDALAARDIAMTYRITSTRTSNPQSDDRFDDEISIFSRFNITHFSQIIRGDYPYPDDGGYYNAPRFILRARVDVGGRPIYFYGAHLKATSASTLETDIKRRRAQAHALETFIKANHTPETDSIVILGDMNTTEASEFTYTGTLGCLMLKCDNPGNTANDFIAVNVKYLPIDWNGLGYPSGHSGGYTWRSYFSHNPWTGLLDHIILSPALYARYVPDSVDILLKGVEPRISDHYPILLKIALD
jgi:endonuclease/exonuclease/phosphatase family metal-dependent hydrolase